MRSPVFIPLPVLVASIIATLGAAVAYLIQFLFPDLPFRLAFGVGVCLSFVITIGIINLIVYLAPSYADESQELDTNHEQYVASVSQRQSLARPKGISVERLMEDPRTGENILLLRRELGEERE